MVVILAAIASRTASAPCPASGGPFLTRSAVPNPSIGGRGRRIVNLLVRSTRVPITDLFSPMIRSPSQCPGTARSSASAGRWLIITSGVMNFLPRPRVLARGNPQGTTGAQAHGKLASERAAALHVKRLVDRLVADPHGLILRKVDPQPVADLLRTPRRGPPPIGLARLVPTLPRRHARTSNLCPVWMPDLSRHPILHI